jgi:molecular chaperone HscA
VIPNTQKVLRQAGNQVDHELKRFILEKAGIRENHGDFARIDASLSLDVRALKEALFRGQGVESYTIVQNDKPVQIGREEFIASAGMRDLERQIHAKFEEMVRSAPASWIVGQQFPRIVLLVTGGGAELPIVSSLDGTTVNVGRALTVRLGTALPPYVERDYPQLRHEYLRLAVALGGSAKDLPEVSAKFHDLGASFDKYVPDVVRKGE